MSLEIAPFDRVDTSSYYRSAASLGLIAIRNLSSAVNAVGVNPARHTIGLSHLGDKYRSVGRLGLFLRVCNDSVLYEGP